MNTEKPIELTPQELAALKQTLNLALAKNPFAVAHIACLETGRRANFQAYLAKECSHALVSPIGRQIFTLGLTELARNDDWAIAEVFCTQCAKRLSLSVRKG